MFIDLDTMKAVYRQAIRPKPADEGGGDWWAEVAAEVKAVIDAPTIDAAAAVIAWWHHDWSLVGDTAKQSARRLRTAAARVAIKH